MSRTFDQAVVRDAHDDRVTIEPASKEVWLFAETDETEAHISFTPEQAKRVADLIYEAARVIDEEGQP